MLSMIQRSIARRAELDTATSQRIHWTRTITTTIHRELHRFLLHTRAL